MRQIRGRLLRRLFNYRLFGSWKQPFSGKTCDPGIWYGLRWKTRNSMVTVLIGQNLVNSFLKSCVKAILSPCSKDHKRAFLNLSLQSLTYLRMSISLSAVDLNIWRKTLIVMELWMHLVDGMMVVVSTEVFLPSSSMEVAALGFCVNQVKIYLASCTPNVNNHQRLSIPPPLSENIPNFEELQTS